MSNEHQIKYLVAGTPRSGTVYMARLLSSLGIMCGHESIFTTDGLNGAISILKNIKNAQTSEVSKDGNTWFNPETQIAESSYMSAPFLNEACLSNCKIIHAIRNPIEVISSIYFDANFWDDEIQRPYRNFVYSHLPELKNIPCKIERTMAFYIWWNELVENKSNITINVENANCQKLHDFLEINDQLNKNVFSNTKINSWKKREKNIDLKEIKNSSTKQKFKHTIEKYFYGKYL